MNLSRFYTAKLSAFCLKNISIIIKNVYKIYKCNEKILQNSFFFYPAFKLNKNKILNRTHMHTDKNSFSYNVRNLNRLSSKIEIYHRWQNIALIIASYSWDRYLQLKDATITKTFHASVLIFILNICVYVLSDSHTLYTFINIIGHTLYIALNSTKHLILSLLFLIEQAKYSRPNIKAFWNKFIPLCLSYPLLVDNSEPKNFLKF